MRGARPSCSSRTASAAAFVSSTGAARQPITLPPTSTDERLRLAADASDGWLYLVTVAGTTGARADLAPTLAPLAARARTVTKLPLHAGFGISTPAQAREAADLTDGIVVGSRAVEAAEQGSAELTRFVGSLRAALDA